MGSMPRSEHSATPRHGTQAERTPSGTWGEGAPRGTQEDSAPSGTQEDSAPRGTQEDSAPSGTQEDSAPSGTREESAPGTHCVAPVLGTTALRGDRLVKPPSQKAALCKVAEKVSPPSKLASPLVKSRTC